MKKSVIGICPVSDQEQEIFVSFAEVNALGAHGYRKISFECENASDKTIIECNNCPIFKSAAI